MTNGISHKLVTPECIEGCIILQDIFQKGVPTTFIVDITKNLFNLTISFSCLFIRNR